MEWLRHVPPAMQGKTGTYDIEQSAVGYLFLARDAEHFPDIWSLLRAMAAAGLQTFPTSQDIIDRVADGRLVLGYNILGSYAADQARVEPDLGLVLLRDFTVVVSRVALVPRAASIARSGPRISGLSDEQAKARRCCRKNCACLPSVLRFRAPTVRQAMQALWAISCARLRSVRGFWSIWIRPNGSGFSGFGAAALAFEITLSAS